MFGWWRRRRGNDIPDALWRSVIERHDFLASRSLDERQRLRELSAEFLSTKEFTGAHGFEITDEVALTITAQAVLPVLHLGLGWYDDFVGIVVHPGQALARRESVDEAGVVHAWEEPLAGEAMDQGPVMLSWADVAEAGASAASGYNVVIHEFIHKIDLRDGRSDGCPPLPAAARRQWLERLEAEHARFREQVLIAERFAGEWPWLDDYAATAPDEFFAVAGEAYFVNRARFGAEFPALLPLFDGFFGPRD
jgi:Mlc titration factor MtfA (ptsG expression regulator)